VEQIGREQGNWTKENEKDNLRYSAQMDFKTYERTGRYGYKIKIKDKFQDILRKFSI